MGGEHASGFKPRVITESSNPQPAGNPGRFMLAGLVLVFLYALHLSYCQNSVLPFLDKAFTDSDMNANLHWAAGIKTQGWLNPIPYHPYTAWMHEVAPYGRWVQWWGGEQIFQQSPLYAYLLAALPGNLLYARIVQALMSAGVCVFLGMLTARIAGHRAGWLAFWLAAFYAPFYACSWPLLRDGLGWFITAALLWALVELTRSTWPSDRSRRLGWAIGALLGFGYLTREFYLLLIPLVGGVLAFFAWRRRAGDVLPRVLIALILTLSPLAVRNYCVGAPLLASSNRFAESFIEGNAAGAHPYHPMIPPYTRSILYQTGAQPWGVIRATFASHPGTWSWVRLELLKTLSLLDPYESPDNLSFYFEQTISPVVRFGLQYWMLLVPALAGLFLTIYRRDRAHLWLWLFLPVLLAGILVGTPISRYRQTLALLLIPWAAYFLSYFWGLLQRRDFRVAGGWGAILLLGWGLVLGPLARQPRQQYERPAEYVLAARICQQLGWEKEWAQTQRELRQKFNLEPP